MVVVEGGCCSRRVSVSERNETGVGGKIRLSVGICAKKT